jgi:transcriptional regulator NrdR family protein
MAKSEQKNGIVCNQCGNDSLKVIYTRRRDGKIIRLRGCTQCKKRFLTLERVIGDVALRATQTEQGQTSAVRN